MDRVELRRAREEVEALQEQVKRLRESHDNLYRLAQLMNKSQTRWLLLYRLTTVEPEISDKLRADLEAEWPHVSATVKQVWDALDDAQLVYAWLSLQR